MPSLSDLLASHFPSPQPRLALGVFAGTAFLALACVTTTVRAARLDKHAVVPSPRDTVLPQLSQAAIQQLPYPPDALPGARDVESPYGTIRTYEWGPEDGTPVLLIHGISTPSVALAPLAHDLVARGCRVMLFDLFGRGYSAAPSSAIHRYDSQLYMTQILLCLQSTSRAWQSFTLIGYSLGGAIALDFASYFPEQISNMVLIAAGGLIRSKHISWKSRLLYSTGWLVPEWVTERLVRKRLWTGPQVTRSVEPEPADVVDEHAVKDRQVGLRSDEVYRSSHRALIPGNSESTVGNVVDWQILHHPGFVPAFISTIRHAPIHNSHDRWSALRKHMDGGRRSVLSKVTMVLGETDPIIVADELVEDATEVMGRDRLDINIIKGAGHEVAISHAAEIGAFLAPILSL